MYKLKIATLAIGWFISFLIARKYTIGYVFMFIFGFLLGMEDDD